MTLHPPTIHEQQAPSLRRALLAHLMRVANSNPCRQRWYPLKDKLCWHFGLLDGYDVQEVRAPCWRCTDGYTEEGECGYCHEGVHHITRTALARFDVEGLIFHRPSYKIESKAEFQELSTGAVQVLRHRITHRPRSEAASREAMLWIYLIFFGHARSWKRLLQEMRSGPTYSFHPLRPLLALASLLQTLSLRHLRYRWQRFVFNLLHTFDDIPF
ncbi:MAG: hypothetical protein J0L73_28495 [Verrucomicrobia bacterium]|nr:hypothetical protein [Verrucomicrobiota bacterium]